MMSDALLSSLRIAGAAMAAQSIRMRVASENLANMNSTSTLPGGDAYRRKIVGFEEATEEASGVKVIEPASVDYDWSPLRTEYNPGHPAADADGNVKLPNVDMMIELADTREANRSYLANIQVIRMARDAISATIDLLKT